MIREGLSYKFSQVIQTGDGYWAVQTSSVTIVPPVPCTVLTADLPEDVPATGQKRSIAQALSSPEKSTICAKIAKVKLEYGSSGNQKLYPRVQTCTQVSDVTMKRDGTLPVRCLGLKDSSGRTKVALFSEQAKQEFVENAVVEISGVYKKTWQGEDQLVTSTVTKCQFVSDNSVTTDVTEEDTKYFASLADFGGSGHQQEDLTFTISGIEDASIYDACDYDGCHKKKMTDGVCPTCSGSTSSKTYRVKLELMKEDGQIIHAVVFEKDILGIFGQITVTEDDTNVDLMSSLVYKLPCQVKGSISHGKGVNLKKINE